MALAVKRTLGRANIFQKKILVIFRDLSHPLIILKQSPPRNYLLSLVRPPHGTSGPIFIKHYHQNQRQEEEKKGRRHYAGFLWPEPSSGIRTAASCLAPLPASRKSWKI